jgi:hypothetical protein
MTDKIRNDRGQAFDRRFDGFLDDYVKRRPVSATFIGPQQPGTSGIHELRNQTAARDGSAFDLRSFHDRFVSYGAGPGRVDCALDVGSVVAILKCEEDGSQRLLVC